MWVQATPYKCTLHKCLIYRPDHHWSGNRRARQNAERNLYHSYSAYTSKYADGCFPGFWVYWQDGLCKYHASVILSRHDTHCSIFFFSFPVLYRARGSYDNIQKADYLLTHCIVTSPFLKLKEPHVGVGTVCIWFLCWTFISTTLTYLTVWRWWSREQ